MLSHQGYFYFLPIVLVLFHIPLQLSYSQVYVGNTTSIYDTYMDHISPSWCEGVMIKNITSNIGGPASKVSLSNLNDGNLSSYWASNHLGTRLTLDLGEQRQLCYIEIAWQGTTQSYNYTINLSSGYSYKKMGDQLSGGNSQYPEPFLLNYEVGQYIEIIANGNVNNNRTGITEIKVYAL